MTTPNFEIAYTIASQLSGERTDHNELAKASTYLNQTREPQNFFKWLAWMASPSISQDLARSNRTPMYYKQIKDACRHLESMPHLEGATEPEKTETMAQTLAWAVRLMRYMPVANPIEGADSLAFHRQKVSTTAKDSTHKKSTHQPRSMRDLKTGMELVGTVKRTQPFGAFVDVGVGHDGLVHISKLKQGFVDDVESVVTQGEQVTVWVEEVDAQKGRLSLTMIEPARASRTLVEEVDTAEGNNSESMVKPDVIPKPVKPPRPAAIAITSQEQAKPGIWVKGTVRRIDTTRILVNVGLEKDAAITFDRLEHIFGYVPDDPDDVAEELPAGTEIEARVLRVSKKGVVQLALKG